MTEAVPPEPIQPPKLPESMQGPLRPAEDFAIDWMQNLTGDGVISSTDLVRVRGQLTDVYGLEKNGKSTPRDLRKIAHRMGLLGMLIAEGLDPVNEARSEEFAYDFVHLIWKEAEAENAKFDAEKERAKLNEVAEHDPLTGLYNHRAWHERVVSKTGKGRSRAVIVIDFDGFKLINDKIGHKRGDQVLVEIGSLLRANSRDTDLVSRIRQSAEIVPAEESYAGTLKSIAGRLGGDEFANALDTTVQVDEPPEEVAPGVETPNVEASETSSKTADSTPSTPRRRHEQLDPMQQAERYIARLRAEFAGYLAEERNADLRNLGFELGLSAGVAFWDGSVPMTHEHLVALVAAADIAMQLDKNERRRAAVWETKNPTEQREIIEYLARLGQLGVRVDARTLGVPPEALAA